MRMDPLSQQRDKAVGSLLMRRGADVTLSEVTHANAIAGCPDAKHNVIQYRTNQDFDYRSMYLNFSFSKIS